VDPELVDIIEKEKNRQWKVNSPAPFPARQLPLVTNMQYFYCVEASFESSTRSCRSPRTVVLPAQEVCSLCSIPSKRRLKGRRGALMVCNRSSLALRAAEPLLEILPH